MVTARHRRASAKKSAIAAFLFVALNALADNIASVVDRVPDREVRRQLNFSEGLSRDPHTTVRKDGDNRYYGGDFGYPTSSVVRERPPLSRPLENIPPVPTAGGYFNLSCPFEWSKYSCARMARGPQGADVVRASTEHYLRNLDAIRSAIERAASSDAGGRGRRVFFAGDSLLRQLYVGIACAAWSHAGGDLIESAAIPWKDDWPCMHEDACFVAGGTHGGFDASSLRLRNGMELHFVPHRGFRDEATSEADVLERLRSDIAEFGGVTFGGKTAMPPGGPVDVLVYNSGIHYGMGQTRKNVNHFANWIARPLMEIERAQNATHPSDGRRYSRPRTVYVTTPSQHYNTYDGQWQQGMSAENKKCVDEIESNPRADLEKELLTPGVNVDAVLDYDDLSLGRLHVHKGFDCSHYCMPGVPDVVAARLLEEFLV